MLLTKDVIKPGVYRKGDHRFLVDEKYIKGMLDSVPQLKQSGYQIPVFMEHPSVSERQAFPIRMDDAGLVAKVTSDPWFAGWLNGGKIDEDKTLHVDIDVPDQLGSRLASTGTFVSPQFGKWKDETGKVWDNAIHHMALTRVPVNKDQTNKFEKSAIDQKTGSVVGSRTIQMSQLSEAGMETVRFSMSDADPPGPSNETEMGDDGSIEDSKELKEAASKFREALAALGIEIGEDAPISGDLKKLASIVGMLVQMTAESALEDQKKQDQGLKGGPGNNALQEQATVIAMSETTTNPQTPPTPPVPAVDPVQFSELVAVTNKLRADRDAMAAALTTMSREKLSSRVNSLQQSGRCTAVEADAMRNQIGTYQFSLSGESNLQQLELEMTIREKLPMGAVIPVEQRTQPNQFSNLQSTPVAGMSSFFNQNTDAQGVPGDIDDARADEIFKELDRQSVNAFGLNPR